MWMRKWIKKRNALGVSAKNFKMNFLEKTEEVF